MSEDDKEPEALTQIKNGTTCFAMHAKYRLPCLKTSCKMHINNECNNNCTFIAIAKNDGNPMTLQQIGDIYDLTRMRVCQIEKRALEHIREIIGPKDANY